MRERLGVASYFVSACLARAADAGAIVGIVLLANEVAPRTAVGGLLAACLTAPHLAGPFAARLLDRASRKQVLLAVAFALYAVALTTSAVLLSHHLVLLAAVAAVVAGACGPLLTGGLSSLLAGLVARHEPAQRRAQGMDAFTYGVAATGGPALIAIVAATASPTEAIFAAAGLAILAAAALLLLPPTVNARPEDAPPALTVRPALGVLGRTGGLRRTAVGTALSAMPIGAISLLAIVFALDHHGTAVQGALLVTVDGVGGLAGSTLAILRPLRGNADRLIRWWTLAVAIGFALCAFSPTILLAGVAFFITGAATSIQFAASLAARSAFSPPSARAQIFVTMAGLKVAFSSLGVALVGLASGVGSFWLLVASVVVVLVGTAYMFADHAHTVSRSRSR
jgi:MFS family permease